MKIAHDPMMILGTSPGPPGEHCAKFPVFFFFEGDFQAINQSNFQKKFDIIRIWEVKLMM